jgi:hypothetical protein
VAKSKTMLTLRLNLLSSKREDRLRHRYQI